MIGLLVSPTDPSLNLSSTAAESPFVIAIEVSLNRRNFKLNFRG